MCGLPGPGYHGGAVTCWAIIRAMVARGHDVTLLSLYDNSSANPYLVAREDQLRLLSGLGVRVELLEYAGEPSAGRPDGKSSWRRLKTVFDVRRSIATYFPWARLAPALEERLAAVGPGAIFCYHFDALSAVYAARVAPVMAGVGDLWHLPGYFRWKEQKPSLRKYLVAWPRHRLIAWMAKRQMREMLKYCRVRGAFAAHYAEWLNRREGWRDVLYLRTPAHDPVGGNWRALRSEHEAKRAPGKYRILLMGDLEATATSSGLRVFVRDVLPRLDRAIGRESFEVHVVGGGRLPDEFRALAGHPSIRLMGRVSPADGEFLGADALLVPTPITLGIRVRIITALSYGCCVVTHEANTRGIREIRHGVNALVAGTGPRLAQELIRALENGPLRKRIQEGARQTFEEYFSETTAANRIVETLESVVSGQ